MERIERLKLEKEQIKALLELELQGMQYEAERERLLTPKECTEQAIAEQYSPVKISPISKEDLIDLMKKLDAIETEEELRSFIDEFKKDNPIERR